MEEGSHSHPLHVYEQELSWPRKPSLSHLVIGPQVSYAARGCSSCGARSNASRGSPRHRQLAQPAPVEDSRSGVCIVGRMLNSTFRARCGTVRMHDRDRAAPDQIPRSERATIKRYKRARDGNLRAPFRPRNTVWKQKTKKRGTLETNGGPDQVSYLRETQYLPLLVRRDTRSPRCEQPFSASQE